MKDWIDKIELPRMSKYLVIAAFLASYNPSKLDSRFFTRTGDNKKAKLDKKSVTAKKRQQLIGPRAFPIQRMLAIFFSIMSATPSTFDVHIQVLKAN